MDRQAQVYEDWDRKQRQRIRALVDDQLVEEHRRRPLGQHSDALERVLAYFRRQPITGKEVIVATRPWEEYRIAVLGGEPGHSAQLLDDTFATEEEAMHGIFLRRLHRLLEA